MAGHEQTQASLAAGTQMPSPEAVSSLRNAFSFAEFLCFRVLKNSESQSDQASRPPRALLGLDPEAMGSRELGGN